jgi:PAS domain S-box-containing protein
VRRSCGLHDSAQRADVTVLLRTEHAVASVLSSATTEHAARPRLLEAIGEALEWQVGAYWEPTVDGDRTILRCVHAWHAPSVPADEFVRASLETTYDPPEVLPGRVWLSGEPAWVRDVRDRFHLARAAAAAGTGLRSAFGVPIRGASAVLGAMEFFSTEVHAPDDALLATMTSLGSQIGQFVERCRAQAAVLASDARKSAILNAAFDCIITMDAEGRIVEVNEATEATFGYTSAQLVGADLAELMIPPGKVRDAHRHGLKRYVETGTSRMVGHPVELDAMRADGSTFPIELAVTRPDLPGPPLFCGYLRDVTERKEAERSLQALADEQAALRRVATAVAAELEPGQLFALITEEVARLLGTDSSYVLRYDDEAQTATVLGAWAVDGVDRMPNGTAVPLDGATVVPTVWRTGRPARVESFEGMEGPLAATLRERGLRSSLGAPVTASGGVWGVVVLSQTTPEPLPPGTEQRLVNFAELAGQAIANAAAREELAASRARIVEAGDAERRRLERNLHDGAQQRLVATSLSVRLAAARVDRDSQLRSMLDRAGEELSLALEELRELARGLHPAILSDLGLGPALETLAERAPVPVAVDVALDGERLPEPVEAAAYYVVAEALTNMAKYAKASEARVRVGRADGRAFVEVADDGVGGADAKGGSGLRGLVDRVEALGGRLTVTSPAGAGTRVRAELPAG